MLDSVKIGGVAYREVKEHVEKLLKFKPPECPTTRCSHDNGQIKGWNLWVTPDGEHSFCVTLTTRTAFIDPSHPTDTPVQIGAGGYYCGTAMDQQEADIVVTWLIARFWPTAEVV